MIAYPCTVGQGLQTNRRGFFMDRQAVIARRNALIEVTADGQQPLTGNIVRQLATPLTYTHLRDVEYDNRYDEVSGFHSRQQAETRRLYSISNTGGFCCLKGWRSRLTAILQENGYAVQYIDHNPAKPADTYQADWLRVFDMFEMRPLQDTCLGQIDMHDGGVIEAPPAFGKSYMFGMLGVLYPRAKIDIVTKSKTVVATIRRHMTAWLPDIGQVGGGKRHNSRITVYTAASLKHSQFDADIVLADEVHQLMTDNYAEWLGRYWDARMFGFTASKETRFDNAYHRMEGLFGPTVFHLPYDKAAQLGVVVPIVVQWLHVTPGGRNPCRLLHTRTARKRHGIWRHDYRNQVIASAARRFVDAGQQTLILVETLEHGLFLRRHLPNFQLCYAEQGLSPDRRRIFVDAGLLGAEEQMTAARRDQLRRGFEAREYLGAIATPIWSTGVSFDALQVLIRAEGSASETANIQAPGRVCRIDNPTGKQCGIVVDCLDEFDKRFNTRAIGRRRAYNKQGWTQYNPDGTLWTSRSRRVGCSYG